jgi:hypothetical protein
MGPIVPYMGLFSLYLRYRMVDTQYRSGHYSMQWALFTIFSFLTLGR